jgi:TrmH family RNA methyltransferase
MREINSASNEYVKMLRSLRQKKYRDKYGKYLVEGAKAIEEAIRFRQPVETVLVSDAGSPAAALAEQSGIDAVLLPHRLLERISDTKTPAGELACIGKLPRRESVSGRFYLALDGLADPKNVGAAIRTADAMGADGVWISDSSADYYGPKAQRAAMGSGFHLNVEVLGLQKRLRDFQAGGGHVIAGSLEGGEYLRGEYGRVCVVVGNETRGVCKGILLIANERFKISIYGSAESLNAGVAAGIMMYEVRKRLKGTE